MKGFFGKALHINLPDFNYREEAIAVLNSWLGGRGLGSYLLYKNLVPGIDPLSPANVLIFTVGPATATAMPGTSRYGVYSKSPLTGFYADSYSGGALAPQIKKSGYDAVIIHGAAKNPVFIEISDTGVKFHSAGDLWGKDTYETENICKERLGVREAQVMVIGKAGENLVRFATISNNYWRQAGRTGMGAVMGSKKIKAIAFHGNKTVDLADPESLVKLADMLIEKGKTDPAVARYRKLGTPMVVGITNPAGAFPSEYWSKGTLPEWRKLSAETLISEYDVKPRACLGCFMACGKLTTLTHGRHQGVKVEGPEYETIYAFGGLCKILDLGEIAYLNDVCDRLGMDTITAGNLIGLAMELSKRDRLPEKIDYGNADQAAELLHKISRKEGLGEILSQGIKRVSSELKAGDLAIHVKGMEPAGYDPRILKGMALGFATSPRGACHLPATFYIFELRGTFDPSAVKGKAEAYIGYEDRLTIMDTMICCRFYRDMLGWPELSQLIKSTTGLELNEKDLKIVANNISTLRHMINCREGWTKADDMLPNRFFDEPLGGKTLTREEFIFMLDEYYKIRGWNSAGMILNPPQII